MRDYQWAVFCLLTPQAPHHNPLHFNYLSLLASFTPLISPSIIGSQFTDVGTPFVIDKLQTVISAIIQSQVQEHAACAVIHAPFGAHMQYKNEGKTFTQNYKHEICFRHKRKDNICISCACANACLPLLADESRGYDVLALQTAQRICHARGPADKNNHLDIFEVKSSLHELASL